MNCFRNYELLLPFTTVGMKELEERDAKVKEDEEAVLAKAHMMTLTSTAQIVQRWWRSLKAFNLSLVSRP